MIEQDKLEGITEILNKYIKTNYKIIKYETADKLSVFSSNLITNLFLLLVFMLFVLFLSLGASYYISNYFNSDYLGFLIVAGFYFLVGCLLVFTRKICIEKPLRSMIIRRLFNQNY